VRDLIKKEEYLIVLDFLPMGKATDKRAEPTVQGIGESYFMLLEVVIKKGIQPKPKDRIYIGSGKREKVEYIKRRITYEDLTSFAKNILEEVVSEIVEKNEKRFVNFFNTSGPITTRMHSLELLPGLGKKHLFNILQERRRKPFESFEDIKNRIEMLSDPKKMIVKRILQEIQNKEERHKLFVA
jgi:putative nucleotide binding protein